MKEILLKMNSDQIIATIAILAALTSSILGIVFSRKKYDISYQHFQQILSWYEKTIGILNSLEMNNYDKLNREILLSELSTQIDLARFYFPNIVNDDFGLCKPAAYQGYRVIILDMLIFYYDAYDKYREKDDSETLRNVKRYFTSEIFIYLNPREIRTKIKKYSIIDKQETFTILNKIPHIDDNMYNKILNNNIRKP